MELNTDRLRIMALSLNQFKLLLEGTHKLEEELKIKPSGQQLEEHTQEAMEWLYNQAIENKKDYPWYTNWQIILKSENISIGSACFMGPANQEREVELGYGINEAYRCNGYMTEAAEVLYKWALEQPTVDWVTAETEKNNTASHKVLEKCGLNMYKESDDGLIWRIGR